MRLESGPPITDAGRVGVEVAAALSMPMREILGRPVRVGFDMPALAMGTVAGPALIAAAFGGVTGLVQDGPWNGIGRAAVGLLTMGVLAATSVAVLWGLEAVLSRLARPLGAEHLARAYAYTLAFLACVAIGAPAIGGLCLFVVAGSSLAAVYHRHSGKPKPPTGADVARDMIPAALGFLAFQVGILACMEGNVHRSIVTATMAALDLVAGP
jgi:hypothetical protein